MHFRLRKADALDDRESLECDQPTTEMALLFFGHQLRTVLTQDGHSIDYIMESRTNDEANFSSSTKMAVSILR